MPTMPEDLSKGEILTRLDALLSTPSSRDELRRLLDSTTPLTTLARDNGIVKAGSEDERHLKEDWFGDKWWAGPNDMYPMTGLEKEELVRGALMVACDEAKARNLPVDCYWICRPNAGNYGTPPTTKPIEASVSWSKSQITLILLTPMPPNGFPDRLGDPITFVQMDLTGKTIAKNLMDGSKKVLIP